MNYHVVAVLILVLTILAGCGNNPPAYRKKPAERVKPVPELNLNLPSEEEACLQPDPEDRSFIEKAFVALESGDHLEALQYFQRFQRTEQGDVERLEARIGIAYLIFVPASPVHDLQAARSMYRELRNVEMDDSQMHMETVIMRDAMDAFHQLEAQISDLRARNRVLSDNLEKREEALKRLRDLTIGSQ